MRINNTILKSLNKERVANVLPGEMTIHSENYMDIILETEKYCNDGWQVQYEYTKRKFGSKIYYVKFEK